MLTGSIDLPASFDLLLHHFVGCARRQFQVSGIAGQFFWIIAECGNLAPVFHQNNGQPWRLNLTKRILDGGHELVVDRLCVT